MEHAEHGNSNAPMEYQSETKQTQYSRVLDLFRGRDCVVLNTICNLLRSSKKNSRRSLT